jgi:queuine/archaeosine tRNA-ribosyltransferase
MKWLLKMEYFRCFFFLQVLKGSAILGVVEGGHSIEAREESAKYLANSPVFGYIIDGLHSNGPDVEQLTFEDVKPALEASLVIEIKIAWERR